jgi:hypothetical protein
MDWIARRSEDVIFSTLARLERHEDRDPRLRPDFPCLARPSSRRALHTESYVLGSGNESFRDSLPDQWSSHAFQVRGNGRLFHEK